MTQLRDQAVEQATLVLTDHELNMLGPNLTVSKCDVSLRLDSKSLMVFNVTFVDCDIAAKRKLNNFLWHSASIQRCRFHGRFVGNDFGRRTSGYGEYGGINQCDFSDAILEGCRFFDCDVTTIVFPKWPCFTLLDPYSDDNLVQMASFDWPSHLGTWMRSYTSFPAPTGTAAITECATQLTRFGVSEEEIKTAVTRLTNTMPIG